MYVITTCSKPLVSLHLLINPRPESSNSCKYSVSLSCITSSRSPAHCTMQNPLAISSCLANEWTTAISMATAYFCGSSVSCTNHVVCDLKQQQQPILFTTFDQYKTQINSNKSNKNPPWVLTQNWP